MGGSANIPWPVRSKPMAFSWGDADLDRIESEVHGCSGQEALCYALAHVTEEYNLPAGFGVDHALEMALISRRDSKETQFGWANMWSFKLSSRGASWQKIYCPWADGFMTLDAFIATLRDWQEKPGTGSERFLMTVGCGLREWDRKHRGTGSHSQYGIGAQLM